MIRAFKPSDLAFVRDSWFQTFKSSRTASGMRPEMFRQRWCALIDRLIADGVITIASDDENPEVILGWLATDGASVLHYAFVRQDFRGMGLLKELFKTAPALNRFTHHTIDWQRAMKGHRWTYDPTIAWAHFNEIHRGARHEKQ